MKITDVSLAELFAATGIQSMAELKEAERELESFGLIRVHRTATGATYLLLNPENGQPLTFPKARA
jgi:hypothetical protein